MGIKIISFSILVIAFSSCSDDNGSSKQFHPLAPLLEARNYTKITSFKEIFIPIDTIKLKLNKERFFNYAFGFKRVNDSLFIVQDITQLKKIILLDKNGNFIRQIGREGEGIGLYKEPVGIAIDGRNEKLIVYDEDSNKFLVFDFTGNLVNESPTKYKYTNISYEENFLYCRRSILNMDFPEEVENIIDIYDMSFILKDSILLPTFGNKESAKYMPTLMNGIIVFKSRLYFASPNNFRIVCYDLAKRDIIAVTDTLPDFVSKVEIKDGEETVNKIEKIKLNSSLFGMYLLKDEAIILWVDNSFILYDLNLNFLTSFTVERNSSFFTENRMYSITKPTISNDSISGYIIIYKYKNDEITTN